MRLLIALSFLIYGSIAYAKDAGDLLIQYLYNPSEVATNEVLALVEIVSLEIDVTPEGGMKQTGTLFLKRIESANGDLPEAFSVRFYKRHAEGVDAWTWDYTVLEKGRRLIGFFNNLEEKWAVRTEGRTNVINNPENIKKGLLESVQLLFKTPLLQDVPKKKQNKTALPTPCPVGADLKKL